MRYAISFILLGCSISLFVIGLNWRKDADYPVWNDSVIQYKTPSIPSEFQREITYLSKTPGMEYETDDGPTVYLQHHYFGWNDCLESFYRDRKYVERPAWSEAVDQYGDAPWIHGDPPHINNARRDGWLKCAEKIRAQLETKSEKTLRDELVVSQVPIVAFILGTAVILLVLSGFILFKRNPMTQRLPTYRPISWVATIPQFIALGLAFAIGCLVIGWREGPLWGIGVYLVYSFGSRSIIPAAHRRGIRLGQIQKFEEAILAYEDSYEFFTRHAWIDKYRSITMMTPGAMCYREMALMNIAFAYSQIGNGDQAKEFYQRTLDEYPNSIMASAALKMLESVEHSSEQV